MSWEEADAAVRAWADKLMADYVKRVRKTKAGVGRPSVVNDGLWGSIRLRPLERALVDSPLVQRLRRIKQLGPAFAVYPSARHTRFEHSLGALHRATTVMDALAAAGESVPEGSLLASAAVIRPWTDAVRVAALLHDSGHVFFGHAGERILTAHGGLGFSVDVKSILADFNRAQDCEDGIKLAEFFSYAIIRSRGVIDICGHFGLKVEHRSPEEVLETLAGALVHARNRVKESERWLSDVLSGPLDVDKQDYVPRDALMAGVGVQIEPHRCAEVLRVCDFREATVLNDPDQTISKGERRVAITFAGISVLEDLLLSRMSLFLRVYKHQKVRLIERLVERVFSLLQEIDALHLLTVDAGLSGIMGICDSVFHDGELLRRVQSEREKGDAAVREAERETRGAGGSLKSLRKRSETLGVLEELANMLHARDFPVRAFAYGRKFPAADGAESQSQPWSDLMAAALNLSARSLLEKEIVDCAGQLAKLADIEMTDADRALLSAAVCLDLSPPTGMNLAPVYVYANASTKDLVSYERLFQPSQWLDALQDSKLVCYVHGPRQWAHVVHAAAELVLARKFGAMSQHLRRAYSRYDENGLAELKETLLAKGGASRSDAPVESLHLILTPPSFIGKKDAEAFARFEAKWRAKKLDPEQTARFQRFYDEGSEQLGIIFDLTGSTAFCKAIGDGGQAGEADTREALLLALEQTVSLKVKDAAFGLVTFKTEGDAVVAAMALEKKSGTSDAAVASALTALAALAKTGWPEAMQRLRLEQGWNKVEKAVSPGLRITVGRGDIEYRSQLRDILGGGATALFIHEGGLKGFGELMVLGVDTGIPSDWILDKKTVEASKTGAVPALAIGVPESGSKGEASVVGVHEATAPPAGAP